MARLRALHRVTRSVSSSLFQDLSRKLVPFLFTVMAETRAMIVVLPAAAEASLASIDKAAAGGGSAFCCSSFTACVGAVYNTAAVGPVG